MEVNDKPQPASDRRARDRRVGERPFDGTERRVAPRRSGQDRRNAPRAKLLIDPPA
jgi:hypothetical protein